MLFALFVLFSILPATVCAQRQNVDSLINILNTNELSNKEKLDLYESIYQNTDAIEKHLIYASKGLALAEKENDKRDLIFFNRVLGRAYGAKGNYAKGLAHFDKALALAQETKNEDSEANVYLDMGIYILWADYVAGGNEILHESTASL
jgi:tetratricopeptide (TPR) repeat protein